MTPKLTPQQIQSAKALYLAGESSTALARRFNVSPTAIRHRLIAIGVSIRDRSACQRTVPLNHQYFSTIDSEGKAYWLGFLLADGSISGNEIRIALKAEDRTHLLKLRTALGSEHTITDYTNGTYPAAALAFKSPAMVANLSALGVTARKSLTAVPPSITADLQQHFWRGVFDGDGNLYVPKSGATYHVMVRLYGSDETCCAFRDWIQLTCNVPCEVRPHRSIFTVQVNGFRQVVRIAKVLYSDASVSLDRKAVTAEWLIAEAARPKRIRLCSVADCGRDFYAKGFCNRHYYRSFLREKRHLYYLASKAHDLNAARNLAAKGACSLGAPGVTLGLNGEVVGSSDHGNRNLASSL